MSVQADQVPPVPSQQEILESRAGSSRVSVPWTQWFIQLREKVNLLNQSFINLIDISGTGIVVKNGATWIARTITGTTGHIDVTNGDGVGGNPTLSLPNSGVSAGSYTNTDITVDAQGRVTAASSGSGGGGGFNPLVQAYIYEEFCSGRAQSTNTGTSFDATSVGTVVYLGGSGASQQSSAEAGVPGYIILNTGTTSTGYARAFSAMPRVSFGGGEITYYTRIRIPVLSDGVEGFNVFVGFQNVISGAPQGLNLIYEDSVNSGQWVLTAYGAGTTTVNTAIAPVANTFIDIKLVITADGLSAEVFIDGVSAGTINTNMPTVPVGPVVAINKTSGLTSRTLHADYVFCDIAVSR